MKILLLIDSLGSGGAQRQMVTLSVLLKERGFDVSFLLYIDEDFFKKDLVEKDIPIHYCLGGNYLKRVLKIRKFIRKGDYDVVISFLEVPGFLNNIACIGGKTCKVINSERSAKERTFSTRRGKIFGWFQRYSDAIVCNSHNAKMMWQKYHPRYKEKLRVIYNTVSLPPINSVYTPKRDGKLHIVVAASYQYLKNPIGVVKALMLLNEEERKKINIYWYGRKELVNGDTRVFDEATVLIENNNLKNTIFLNDATDDIANKMNEADMVALFSELEGLPNAICEGMMLGKPIIMTKVSDYTQLVDESNGFLCDWDDTESIRDAFVSAINLNEEKLAEMGACSKEKANELFSNERVVNQWIKLIEE